jgi:hypothetical protein
MKLRILILTCLALVGCAQIGGGVHAQGTGRTDTDRCAPCEVKVTVQATATGGCTITAPLKTDTIYVSANKDTTIKFSIDGPNTYSFDGTGIVFPDPQPNGKSPRGVFKRDQGAGSPRAIVYKDNNLTANAGNSKGSWTYEIRVTNGDDVQCKLDPMVDNG